MIAGNPWYGYLTLERDGTRIDIVQDGLPTAKDYYFHVPPSTEGASDILARGRSIGPSSMPREIPLQAAKQETQHQDIYLP